MVDAYSGQRYFYAPNVMLLMMIFFGILFQPIGFQRKVLTAILSVALIKGFASYQAQRFDNGGVMDFRDQAALFQTGIIEKIEIWPRGIFMELKK